MPELPHVQALADVLTERFAGNRVAALEISAISALKTADPPFTAVAGQALRSVGRAGKFLVFAFDDLFLVVHLARAGWVRASDSVPAAAARPGRGPLVIRLVLVTEDGEPAGVVDVTEAGTRKGASVYIVRQPADVPGIGALGPDALGTGGEGLTAEEWREVLSTAGGQWLKNAIRDQRLVAGIGNAYSDEILQRAKLSPVRPASSLDDAELAALADAAAVELNSALAVARATDPTAMKAEKKAGLRIHGRTGQPCPDCGTTIAEVASADSSFQYCPGCQTGGKVLADRRLSRLLK
ncbi:MAG: Fpg/Nei family DNA glycosylase [Actinobacteria bacterium]|nr:MAG: Fpg/Nei family DNA glycosylase [Actinomycetota bacterium]